LIDDIFTEMCPHFPTMKNTDRAVDCFQVGGGRQKKRSVDLEGGEIDNDISIFTDRCHKWQQVALMKKLCQPIVVSISAPPFSSSIIVRLINLLGRGVAATGQGVTH
jgi:hypothetical protein